MLAVIALLNNNIKNALGSSVAGGFGAENHADFLVWLSRGVYEGDGPRKLRSLRVDRSRKNDT